MTISNYNASIVKHGSIGSGMNLKTNGGKGKALIYTRES